MLRKWLIDFMRRLKQMPLAHLCLLGITLIPLWMVGHEWTLRMIYEWQGPWTWDTTVYWAVGRALTNGLVNYRDFMDIKPPGIHLISALSYWLSGNSDWTHVWQVMALVGMVLLMVWGAFLVLPRTLSRWSQVHWLSFSLMVGFLISLYAARRSGEVQVESFGAFFALLYGVLLQWKPQKRVGSIGRLILLTVAMLGACGFKEPFLLILIAIACLFLDSFKSWLMDFMRPLGLAILLGALILLMDGSFMAYVQEYLSFMMSQHISRFGSPWTRGLDGMRFWADYNHFTLGFGPVVFLWMIFLVLRQLAEIPQQMTQRIFQVLRLTAAIYFPFVTVGLGGEFYNHHFVFALPALAMWFVWFVKQESRVEPLRSRWIPVFAVICVMPCLTLSTEDYEGKIRNLNYHKAVAVDEANYVDGILDQIQEKQYLFLGVNGPQLYGWSQHSPMGPLFIQTPLWMQIPYWRASFLRNLQMTSLVVEDDLRMLGTYQGMVKQYLEKHFTLEPWPEVKDIPRKQRKYRIYFRKKDERTYPSEQ